MLSINPFMKMLESFFRYLWIFSKKNNLPSYLLFQKFDYL